MKKRKNRKTLKKRIQRAMNLSAFILVVFFSTILAFFILVVTAGFAAYQAETMSLTIQRDINTGNALETLGIDSIDQLDMSDPKTDLWMDSLNESVLINKFIEYTSSNYSVDITITVNDTIVYTNVKAYSEDTPEEELSELLMASVVEKPILDLSDKPIGNILVSVNPKILIGILAPLLIMVVFLSLFALTIAKILSKFLTIPVINPLNQLVKKVQAIADGDHETAVNTQLILKKPLREIELLADSTNCIMRKLSGYNEMLENQKEVLENQNAELEMQNEELIDSKEQIQKQQAQLVQSEKMASVGMLTAAITHEINTPIGAINSNAQLEEMLLMGLENNSIIQENEELSTMLSQLKEVNEVNLIACSRIIEIIKSLKSFSRLDQAEFQEANINDGIKSVLVLTRNLLKNRITVHQEYGDIPLVKCFPGQLNQVVMNIVVNASQAIEGEGNIFIRTYEKDNNIYISIKDSGTGIKQEDIIKLFEPGFTTKGVGIGLGLGLYISYNIIQHHHGEISVVSELGKGAEFIIEIPKDITLSDK